MKLIIAFEMECNKKLQSTRIQEGYNQKIFFRAMITKNLELLLIKSELFYLLGKKITIKLQVDTGF